MSPTSCPPPSSGNSLTDSDLVRLELSARKLLEEVLQKELPAALTQAIKDAAPDLATVLAAETGKYLLQASQLALGKVAWTWIKRSAVALVLATAAWYFGATKGQHFF